MFDRISVSVCAVLYKKRLWDVFFLLYSILHFCFQVIFQRRSKQFFALDSSSSSFFFSSFFLPAL